jgi:hypothetical protein
MLDPKSTVPDEILPILTVQEIIISSVPDEILSILTVQETILNTVPMLADFRMKTSLERAFAENCDIDDPIDIIRQYSSCVLAGIIPPLDILLAVATRFQSYLDAAGSEKLGDFFSPPIRGKRELLVQKLSDEERNRVFYFMWNFQKRESTTRPVSILAAAGAAIEEYKLRIGRDTLEKAYHKSGVAAIFDAGYDAMKDTEEETKQD